MLTEALEHLVGGIVDRPEDVVVKDRSGRRGRTLEVRVHPDDLGSHVREHHAAERGGCEACQLDNPDALKWSHRHVQSSPVPSAVSQRS